MKRFICIICLLALLLSGCSFKLQKPSFLEKNYTYGVYQLTFKEKQLSNNFVGNEWSFTYTYDDMTIKSGYETIQPLDKTPYLSIKVKVREDDKIDDLGIGTLYVAIRDGSSGKTNVTVTETNGRYQGNTAVWEITCEVKLIDKK